MSLTLTPVQHIGEFYQRKIGSPSKFNWFSCGCPIKDDKGNFIVKLNEDALFFDIITGNTYQMKDVDCPIILANNSNNKHKIRWLGKWCVDNTEKLSSECSLLKHIHTTYRPAKKLGYCGVGYETDMCTGYPDLICEGSVIIIDNKKVKRVKQCPYIKYAIEHYKCLSKVIKDFPSLQVLKDSKGGQLSLSLRQVIFENKIA